MAVSGQSPVAAVTRMRAAENLGRFTKNIPVGHWVTTQRPKHRQDRVTPKRTTTLQALPGWNWAPRTPR